MEKQYTIFRDANGIPHIEGISESAMYRGLGYVHGRDRGLQLLLTRLIGQGRISEFLSSDDESFAIDRFFRKMNWNGETAKQVKLLSEKEKRIAQSYADGINHALSEGLPFEFKLFGYRPGPWKIEDSVLLSRMTGYITLTDSIYDMKKLLLELILRDVPARQLKELYPELDEKGIELIKKVKLEEPLVPETFWGKGISRLTASNNWVVSGKKTSSGSPIHAADPHLELRLPAVWQEVSMKYNGRYMTGASMPGMPGVLIGRNPDVSWSATFTFMDAVDFWVEDCRGGMYRSGNKWKKFSQRKEIIHRKGKSPVTVVFHENERGVLEGDPANDDFLLTFNWSGARSGGKSLRQIFRLFHAKNVKEGMNLLGQMETSWNWLLADSSGNIGYQMSGLLPERQKKSILPLPGWEAKNNWKGFVHPSRLPSAYNPKTGYLITANQNLNHMGKAKPITWGMGPYRAQRIEKLLKKTKKTDIETMKEIQYDLFSIHAESFMKILRPLLPDSENGRVLKEWDMRYTSDSAGAFFFERFYTALVREIFHMNGYISLGEYITRETSVLTDYYLNFDRILLQRTSSWFGGRKREEVYLKVLEEALSVPPEKYGKTHSLSLKHMLFGGRLPAISGFDSVKMELPGGRSTILQGQIHKSRGRETSFFPVFRMITDMSTDAMFTNLAGGPSDRRFSRWYTSDLKNWQEGVYKKLAPDPETRHPFEG